ncbi:MAG: hypothetical protein FD137_2404 [Spirochaetes bacterium]|nr:MAG: hypothetical protein FD137_2404 [Spirochaetota bacterium]
MVAERPGMAPTNMPMIVPRHTIRRLKGWKTFVRPNMIFSAIIEFFLYPSMPDKIPIGTGRWRNNTKRR